MSESANEGAYAPISRDLEEVGAAIVDAGIKVHKTLGPGLLESVYEQCLAYELEERGYSVRRQVPLRSFTARSSWMAHTASMWSWTMP
jgi:hypothetical protein